MTVNNFLLIILGYLSFVQCIKLIPVRGHRPTDYHSVKKSLSRASELRARLNELVRDFSISDSNRLQVSALLRAHKLIENSLKVFDAEVTKTHMSMACPEGDDCVSNSLDFCRRIRLAIEDESSYFLTYMDQIISKGWISISEPAVDSTEGAYVGLLSSFRSKEEVRLLFLHWYGVAQRQKQKQAEASQDSQRDSESPSTKAKVLKTGNLGLVYFVLVILGGMSVFLLYYGVSQNIFTSQKLKNSHRRKQLQKYFFTALRLFNKYGLIVISIMNDSIRLFSFFGESVIDNIRIVFQTYSNECRKSTQKQNSFCAKTATKNTRKVIVKQTTFKKKTATITTTTSSTATVAMFTPVIPIVSLGNVESNAGLSSTLEAADREFLDDDISSGKSARSSPDTVARKASVEEEVHDGGVQQRQQQRPSQPSPVLLPSSVFLEYRADNEEEWLRKISALSDEDWLLQDREGNEDEGWVTLLGTATGRNRGRGKKLLSPSSSIEVTRKSALSPSIDPCHQHQQQQQTINRMNPACEKQSFNNVNKNKKLGSTSTDRRSRRRTRQSTAADATTTPALASLSRSTSNNSRSGSPKKPLTCSNSLLLPVTGQATSSSSSLSQVISEDQISVAATSPTGSTAAAASPLPVALTDSPLAPSPMLDVTKNKSTIKNKIPPLLPSKTGAGGDSLSLGDRGSADEANQTDGDSDSESPDSVLEHLSFDSGGGKTSSYLPPGHAFPPPLAAPTPAAMSIAAPPPPSLIVSANSHNRISYYDHYYHYHQQLPYPDTAATTPELMTYPYPYPAYQEAPFSQLAPPPEERMAASGYYPLPAGSGRSGMMTTGFAESQQQLQQPPSLYQHSQYTNHNNNNLIHVVRSQMEYYFSVDNLCRDLYLRSKMDSEGFVFLREIIQFNRMKIINAPLHLILEAVQSSSLIEVALPWAAKVASEPLSDEVVLSTRLRCACNWSQWIMT